jgi:hypothetical protein
VFESVQNHYQAQFAAENCQVTPLVLNPAEATPVDNTVIFRGAFLSLLVFIWAVILGSFVFYHTLMN